MENDDYSSDSSDEDYVPNGGEIVSEEEDSGDEEDFVPGEDNDGNEDKEQQTSNSGRRSKLQTKGRRGGRQSKANDNSFNRESKTLAENEKTSKNDQTEEMKELEEKKKADALWADFMKDVGGTSKAKSTVPISSESSDSPTSSSFSSRANANKITVKKEYDFAGETVVVTKEVDANSKDAKSANSSDTVKTGFSSTAKTSTSTPSTASVAPTLKRTGGLSAVLSKLDKKPKLSTLEKSKLDWDGFKQKEGIDEELKTHNRGKEGYLERVAFLERTDHRQFEIERDLRLGTSRKQ